jgi:hypothetical protein
VRGSGCIDPRFLDLGPSESSASRPSRFNHRERAPGTHLIGGRVSSRAGLDAVEKRKFLPLPGLELRPLGRPACSQPLYPLRYPGSFHIDRSSNGGNTKEFKKLLVMEGILAYVGRNALQISFIPSFKIPPTQL